MQGQRAHCYVMAFFYLQCAHLIIENVVTRSGGQLSYRSFNAMTVSVIVIDLFALALSLMMDENRGSSVQPSVNSLQVSDWHCQ